MFRLRGGVGGGGGGISISRQDTCTSTYTVKGDPLHVQRLPKLKKLLVAILHNIAAVTEAH